MSEFCDVCQKNVEGPVVGIGDYHPDFGWMEVITSCLKCQKAKSVEEFREKRLREFNTLLDEMYEQEPDKYDELVSQDKFEEFTKDQHDEWIKSIC